MIRFDPEPRAACCSRQVLQEYASVALTKLGPRQAVVVRQLALLEGLNVVTQTPALVRRAVELHSLSAIDFRDAAIVAAAEHAECARILSEDLNPGVVLRRRQFAGGQSIRFDLAQPARLFPHQFPAGRLRQ